MNNLKNKTAFITGATSGIGKATAKLLAKKGVNLILTGRRKNRLKTVQKVLSEKYDIKIKTFTLDVTNSSEVEKKLSKMVSKYNIDILVNNAGLALGLETVDNGLLSDWETMIDTNIKGLLYVSKIVLTHMKKRNSGDIINLGSIAGEMEYPNGNVYCATKHAVHSLTKSMNIDCLGTNIRVSTVAPGAVQTEFSDIRFHGDKTKAKAVYDGYTPLKAKDIANLIVYILNAPKHVNIQHSLIMPTAQRNPYLIHKEL